MDGTLIDSERLARACFLLACEDIGWLDPDIEVYNRCVGSTGEESQRIMRAGYGARFPYDRMEARWSYHYHKSIDSQPVPVLDGILELLALLRDMEVPMAVATSSRRPVVEKKLAGSGIDTYFAHLVCGGEAHRGKPHPAPYEMAVSKLTLSPSDCWAVEDSDNGVRSAVAAGLQVFQIPNELAPSAEMDALGHDILVSAQELLARLHRLQS